MTEDERRAVERMSMWQLARTTGKWWAYAAAILLWPLTTLDDTFKEWRRVLPATSRLATLLFWGVVLYFLARACL